MRVFECLVTLYRIKEFQARKFKSLLPPILSKKSNSTNIGKVNPLFREGIVKSNFSQLI